MIQAGERRATRAARGAGDDEGAPAARQSGRPGVRKAASGGAGGRPGRSALHLLEAVIYACMQVLMSAAVRVCFRRVRDAGRERFPSHGPAVLVANHPASWTDVVILDVAFGRKLHFLAHEPLFHPWPRRLLLGLFGSLPVYFRHETPDGMERNLETFERCHALLERGEAVAIFPEGVSDDDRVLRPLKTGAARMLLEGPDAPWTTVPVAIRYEDRLAFRGDVAIVAGPPIAAEPFRRRCVADPAGAAHAFTAAMAQGIETALAEAAATGVSRSAISPVAWLGAAGVVLHAPVRLAIEAGVRRWTARPQRVAFGRILGGIVLLPVWYAVLAGAAAVWLPGPWPAWALITPVLGAFACVDLDRRRMQAAAGRGPRESGRSREGRAP